MESENFASHFQHTYAANCYFDRYALNEYYLLGMYYGMIPNHGTAHHLYVFFLVKEKTYIFYVL